MSDRLQLTLRNPDTGEVRATFVADTRGFDVVRKLYSNRAGAGAAGAGGANGRIAEYTGAGAAGGPYSEDT